MEIKIKISDKLDRNSRERIANKLAEQIIKFDSIYQCGLGSRYNERGIRETLYSFQIKK